MLLSDAAEVPCAGPLDCGWEADAGAAGGPGESEFTGAEEGAVGLPVQKKVQLGYSSPDALSHHSTLYTPVEAS